MAAAAAAAGVSAGADCRLPNWRVPVEQGSDVFAPTPASHKAPLRIRAPALARPEEVIIVRV
jgi:hypothetical protein